jgi:translation initiation factor eIF-2B subunit beta
VCLQNKQEEVDAQESLHKIVTSEGDVLDDYSKLLPDLRSSIMEHIGEFEMELETRYYHHYYCYCCCY